MNPEKLILIKNIATAIFLQILSTQLAFSQDAIYKCRLENGKIEIKDKPCTTNTRTERVLEKEYIPEERIEQAQRRRLEISAEKKRRAEYQLYEAIENQRRQNLIAEQQARDAHMRQIIREEQSRHQQEQDRMSDLLDAIGRQKPQPQQPPQAAPQFCKQKSTGQIFCW